ncbi:hypothetical protein M4D52_05300 [Paenibacillus lactis]|uniref:hypothetical protein n=1 Tax=Paenibacillus lactis TaxID=228574 RepID=UPI00203BA316|nr:hypothetical protein [Paenibacillus lactis]MCM3492856.1 hypothetical protein [Paenibacillus lactis]
MTKYVCADCGAWWSEFCNEYEKHNHVCKNKKKEKFTLEFDESPALVFVQERGSNKIKVYQDGIELHGVRAVDINAHVDDVTTHTIEFITGYTKDK